MLTTRIHDALADIAQPSWDALNPGAHPFVSYAFLEGLERHGCIIERLGWYPHHVALYRGEHLVAAAPCYLKSNSHGEFVFDHAWAEAHHRVGIEYYPKLLCAVPYSPVTGPRLLVAADEPESTRVALAAAIVDESQRLGLSSAHVNFPLDAELPAFDRDRFLARSDWQFHWENADYVDFEVFLDTLTAKRRKEIRRERRKVADSGWQIAWRERATLDAATLDFVYQCYANTFADKGNYPALTLDFFRHLARTMPSQVLVAIASRDGAPGAMAFFLHDGNTLYGRYWGALEESPALHFELCYYQGIAFCIERGLRRFEPGAQGEHKIARGFLPTRTHSFHAIADPRLRDAIARSLKREAAWLEGYRDTLMAHSPYAQRSP